MEDKKQLSPEQVSDPAFDIAKLADEVAAQAVRTVKMPDAGMSVLDELAKLRPFRWRRHAS